MKLTHVVIILLLFVIIFLLLNKKNKTGPGPGEQNLLSLGDIGLDIGPDRVVESNIRGMY